MSTPTTTPLTDRQLIDEGRGLRKTCKSQRQPQRRKNRLD